MVLQQATYGFRIVGSLRNERRLVDAPAALAAYAACDAKADVDRESYLSAFQFGADFRERDDGWKVDVRGFDGPCWSPWLWFDIDDDDLDAAALCARKLAACLADRYQLDGDELLLFFSGSKGFHLGLPTSLWACQPSVQFNEVARRFAEQRAEAAGVKIDGSVYDKVRAFRAPNSRHPKSGLHKRRLAFNELMHLKSEALPKLAESPEPFDLPPPPPPSAIATTDWRHGARDVELAAEALQQRRLATNGAASLNRATLEFIRDGAIQGDRHRLLFSAAANLAEFGCPPELAHALLHEAGLDSGLPPKDVRRQIDCGLARRSVAPIESEELVQLGG